MSYVDGPLLKNGFIIVGGVFFLGIDFGSTCCEGGSLSVIGLVIMVKREKHQVPDMQKD